MTRHRARAFAYMQVAHNARLPRTTKALPLRFSVSPIRQRSDRLHGALCHGATSVNAPSRPTIHTASSIAPPAVTPRCHCANAGL